MCFCCIDGFDKKFIFNRDGEGEFPNWKSMDMGKFIQWGVKSFHCCQNAIEYIFHTWLHVIFSLFNLFFFLRLEHGWTLKSLGLIWHWCTMHEWNKVLTWECVPGEESQMVMARCMGFVWCCEHRGCLSRSVFQLG